jgi:hypothetical protein
MFRRTAITAEPGEDAGTLSFDKKLQSLNIAAALIDANFLEEAERVIDSTEKNLDNISKVTLLSEVQLERVVLLAQRERYGEARSVALFIRSSRSGSHERDTALRISAALEAKRNGSTSVYQWAVALPDAEDRAYALLGIAQTLLGIDDTRLPYTAIQVH